MFMVQNQQGKTQISLKVPIKLKQRIEEYSQSRGISQSGAMRLILNENLPKNNKVES